MCSSNPPRRCAAHTEPVATAKLGFYHQAFPAGANVDPLSAVEATYVPILGERTITVPDPDDELGMPIYEGSVAGASELLEGGEYKAYFRDADPDTAQELALRVPDSPTVTGDRVVHPVYGHGTVRRVGSDLASGQDVLVQWDNPRATTTASQGPTWEEGDQLRRIITSDEFKERISPDWAPGVNVDARSFPDVNAQSQDPVYWVTGADLQRLQQEAGLGSYDAVLAGETSAYLTFEQDGPTLHWPEEPGNESLERLATREFEGETLYSLEGFTFVASEEDDED